MMMENKSILLKSMFIVFVVWFATDTAISQTYAGDDVPDAPQVQSISRLVAEAALSKEVGVVQVTNRGADTQSKARNRLTRTEAEKMAVKNNPRMSVSQLLALAQRQVVREVQAAKFPTTDAALTAVEAENGSRISAGSLTSSRLLEHAGAGVNITQLITDFGRTTNLVTSSKLQEKAQNANVLATQLDITLATDQAFYNALEGQELLKVAGQNVSARQALQAQVNQMTANKLKSTLDLSFADVNLSQAKLLLLDAQNNAASSMATLDAILGLDHEVNYQLVDDFVAIQQPPPDIEQLVQQGLRQRPDLLALNLSQQAAVKFSHAQHDQMFPSIGAAGTVGSVPIRPAEYYTTNWWGAVGVNVKIPLFNGFLYSAQAKEASIRAQAEAERVRDLRDRIVRDVRTAWLTANTAYQRVAVTTELLKEANLSLTLAQTRYKMGLSSIVELSQAEYQQTDAAIGNTNAIYQYRLAIATLGYQVGSNP